MDLRVLGVYGVQKLELELVVVVRLRAVRLGVRAERQHAVVRQVHLGIFGVGALQREEQPIFALRPVRERNPWGIARDGVHRLDERTVRQYVALAELLDGRVSRLRARDESDDTTRPRTVGTSGKTAEPRFPKCDESSRPFLEPRHVRGTRIRRRARFLYRAATVGGLALKTCGQKWISIRDACVCVVTHASFAVDEGTYLAPEGFGATRHRRTRRDRGAKIQQLLRI